MITLRRTPWGPCGVQRDVSLLLERQGLLRQDLQRAEAQAEVLRDSLVGAGPCLQRLLLRLGQGVVEIPLLRGVEGGEDADVVRCFSCA